MALSITHRFASAKSDSSDTSLINPSNWNDTHVVSGMPFFDASSYAFTAQSPGGTLTAGITNSITLTPVPAGVNGTDVGHYLYPSGGVGTAEAVLITGGTAVSGAASGTITFVPANNHSGAWTIQSATAGIQEAEQARKTSGAGKVYIPGGTYQLRSQITYTDGSVFVGDGDSTKIIPASSTASTFVNANGDPGSTGNKNSKVGFFNFLIDGSAYTGINTCYGIRMNLQNSIWNASIAGVTIEHITFNNIRYAVYGERTQHVSILNCHLYLNTTIKITDTVGDATYRSFNTFIQHNRYTYTYMDGTGTTTMTDYVLTLTKCVIAFITGFSVEGTLGTAGGIHVTHASEGVVIDGCSILLYGASGNPNYGIFLEETTMNAVTVGPTATQISNCIIDMVYTNGIVWRGSIFGATGLQITNTYITANPTTGGVTGLQLDGTALSNVSINGLHSSGSFSAGNIYIAQSVTHVTIFGGSLTNSHASGPCVFIDNACQYINTIGIDIQATSGTAITETSTYANTRPSFGNIGSTTIAPRLTKPMSITPVTAPSTPTTGTFVLYVDTADSKLKVKSGAGTVTVLALP